MSILDHYLNLPKIQHLQKKELRIKEIRKKTAKKFISLYHYLGSTDFLCQYAFGLYAQDRLTGVIIFHPISVAETIIGAFGLTKEDQKGFFELGRLAFIPAYNGNNFASWFISRVIKDLRKKANVRALITYADSRFHTGIIYQACSFTYCGLTKEKCDYYYQGRKINRGKVSHLAGEWLPRPRKHRYIKIFDKKLISQLRWSVLPYPKNQGVESET